MTQVTTFLGDYGLIGLFISVTLESVGLPLPGETAVILAGGLAATGDLNVYAVFTTVLVAASIGNLLGYVIGRTYGRTAIVGIGSRFGLTAARLDHVEQVIQKRGVLVVVFARFVVVVRQLNGLVAGAMQMHWFPFMLANVIGAALWSGMWTFLSYRFTDRVAQLPEIWEHFTPIGGGLMALGVAALVGGAFWVRHHRRKRRKPPQTKPNLVDPGARPGPP